MLGVGYAQSGGRGAQILMTFECLTWRAPCITRTSSPACQSLPSLFTLACNIKQPCHCGRYGHGGAADTFVSRQLPPGTMADRLGGDVIASAHASLARGESRGAAPVVRSVQVGLHPHVLFSFYHFNHLWAGLHPHVLFFYFIISIISGQVCIDALSSPSLLRLHLPFHSPLCTFPAASSRKHDCYR